MKVSLSIGRKQGIGLGGIQSDGLDFGMLVFTGRLHDERAEHRAKCEELFVAEMDLPVDHDAVLVEGTLRVRRGRDHRTGRRSCR